MLSSKKGLSGRGIKDQSMNTNRHKAAWPRFKKESNDDIKGKTLKNPSDKWMSWRVYDLLCTMIGTWNKKGGMNSGNLDWIGTSQEWWIFLTNVNKINWKTAVRWWGQNNPRDQSEYIYIDGGGNAEVDTGISKFEQSQ